MRKKTRVILVTVSAGLIASETVRRFGQEDYCVVGIDNDMRSRFFGPEASTQKTRDRLINDFHNYNHHEVDIRDRSVVENIFAEHQGQYQYRSTAGVWGAGVMGGGVIFKRKTDQDKARQR
jgi:CDP-paratose 2-epimerase